jgi:hypothetical protein
MMGGARLWCLVLLLGGTVTASSQPGQGSGPDWLNVNGEDWRRMEPKAQLAYVEGFLAGAALGQAAGRAADTSAVRGVLEDLKRNGRLRFPFSANVYASRVSDYYWWTNHLPLPTWYAFLEVNTTLGRRLSDSVP